MRGDAIRPEAGGFRETGRIGPSGHRDYGRPFLRETLESLTDEVKSSGFIQFLWRLQPWSSASGSKSESGSQPSRSEYGDHQSELDFKANVKKLSRKWIHNLKGKEKSGTVSSGH